MSETIGFPTTPEEITPDWLTKALTSTGVIAKTNITALTVELLSGEGIAGQLARIRVIYDSDVENAPTTLIAKLSNPDPNIRKGISGIFKREVCVYRELANQIALPVPHCYYGAFNYETAHSILLLQDLAHWRRVDWGKDCSLTDAETIITHLARFHAQWWENPQLETLDYLDHLSAPFTDEDLECYQAAWAKFEDKVTALLPDSYLPQPFLDIGYRFVRQMPEIKNQMLKSPFTFVHNDVHTNNIIFAVNENDPPLMVLDWQTCGVGVGPLDLGFFMLYSATLKQRRQTEKHLLQIYHATLVENGITNYNFSQCWRDYRLSFFAVLERLVFVAAYFEIIPPFLRSVLEVGIPRLASFAEDHRVEEFLTTTA